VDWIYLPQGKVWRWISANVIMKVWVPWNWGISLLAEWMLAFKEAA
jgi:hypothetical protein